MHAVNSLGRSIHLGHLFVSSPLNLLPTVIADKFAEMQQSVDAKVPSVQLVPVLGGMERIDITDFKLFGSFLDHSKD